MPIKRRSVIKAAGLGSLVGVLPLTASAVEPSPRPAERTGLVVLATGLATDTGFVRALESVSVMPFTVCAQSYNALVVAMKRLPARGMLALVEPGAAYLIEAAARDSGRALARQTMLNVPVDEPQQWAEQVALALAGGSAPVDVHPAQGETLVAIAVTA